GETDDLRSPPGRQICVSSTVTIKAGGGKLNSHRNPARPTNCARDRTSWENLGNYSRPSWQQFEKNFFGSVSVPGRACNNHPLYRRSYSKTGSMPFTIGFIACGREWLCGGGLGAC